MLFKMSEIVNIRISFVKSTILVFFPVNLCETLREIVERLGEMLSIRKSRRFVH